MPNQCDHGSTVVPFAALHQTPVIPKLYWDVYSAEERIKRICCMLDKLADYVNSMAVEINDNTTDIETINDVISAIENGEYTEQYIDGLAAYIDKNLIALVARLTAYVFPGLVYDGNAWRVSMVVPQGWDFLRFRYVWVPEDGTYHITLNY